MTTSLVNRHSEREFHAVSDAIYLFQKALLELKISLIVCMFPCLSRCEDTGMGRKYLRRPGNRRYQDYTNSDLENALEAIKNGLSKVKAARIMLACVQSTIKSKRRKQVNL